MNKILANLWTIALASVLFSGLPVASDNSKGGDKYIMTSSKKTSKKIIEQLTTINPTNKKKITLATLIIAVSLSVAIEFGVAAALTQGYSTPADSYKNTLCMGKVLDLSQKGVIRDVGGFNGGIYECMRMKSANSIYGDVLSTLKI